jgi:hypothetical protein
MNKDKPNKSRCTKKKYRITASEVAELCGCSVSYVKKLRAGHVDNTSPLARQVAAVDLLAASGTDAMIQEIERLMDINS